MVDQENGLQVASARQARGKARPYVFCHMEVSLDGKIMGRFWDVLDDLSDNPFFDVAFGPERVWDHQGWISGRVTTDDNFTHYERPELREDAPAVPAGDYLVDSDRELYYVSIDPHGRLGWQEDVVRYRGLAAKVIEVVTEQVADAYLDFLRRRRIPYLVCGHDALDFPLMLDKLRDGFGFTCVMLGGGGTVNWSMIQQGLCDELSVIVDPSADGSRATQPLFMQADGLSTTDPVRFHIKDVRRIGAGGERLWLRYAVDNERIREGRVPR